MICGVPLLDRKIAPKKNCNPKESPKGVNFIKSHENHPAVLEKETRVVGGVKQMRLQCFQYMITLFHVSLDISTSKAMFLLEMGYV